MTERVDMWITEGTKRVNVKVAVTDTCVNWSRYDSHVMCTLSLRSRQILPPQVTHHDDRGDVVINYCKVVFGPNDSVTLRRDAVTFEGSRSQCQHLCEDVKSLLERREGHRPKRALLFMNPASGWKASVKQYRSVVAPTFAAGGLSVHAIETRDGYHASDVLADYDLAHIDVVVSIGGDGSVKQVVTGLMARAAADAGTDMDDPEAEVVKPSIPVGVVPCGSGMAIAMNVNASRDIETAALNIVLGRSVNADIIITRNRGKFLGYGSVMESIGGGANCMAILEKLRWMATFRYTIFVYLPIMRWTWRLFNIEVHYKPVTEDQRAFELLPTAKSKEADTNERITDGPLPGWKMYRGLASGADLIPWKLMDFVKRMYARYPEYAKPDMSSGKALLVLQKDKGFLAVLKSLGDCMKLGRRSVSRDVTEQVEVSECRIIGVEPWSVGSADFVCHDGDVLPLPNGHDIHMKVHANKLDMMCIDDSLVSEAFMYRL